MQGASRYFFLIVFPTFFWFIKGRRVSQLSVLCLLFLEKIGHTNMVISKSLQGICQPFGKFFTERLTGFIFENQFLKNDSSHANFLIFRNSFEHTGKSHNFLGNFFPRRLWYLQTKVFCKFLTFDFSENICQMHGGIIIFFANYFSDFSYKMVASYLVFQKNKNLCKLQGRKISGEINEKFCRQQFISFCKILKSTVEIWIYFINDHLVINVPESFYRIFACVSAS